MSSSSTFKKIVVVGGPLIVAMVAVSQAALAAAATPSVGHARLVALNEVLVTAQRISQNIERVPISIAAISAHQLAEQSITDERDLQSAVAGLTVRATEQPNQLNYSIRGQTVDAFSGSSPGVLPYLNDVQVSGVTATDFYDLSSVQVLKGPQGTLFGRNTTGGAVLFTTEKPSNIFGGYVTGSVGNLNLREVQGAVNLPLVRDRVLIRIAGDYRHRHGYVRNIVDDQLLGTENDKSARATLIVRPNGNLKSDTMIQYSRYAGTALVGELYSVNSCGSSNRGIPLFSELACLYNPAALWWPAFLAANPKAFPGGLSGYLLEQRTLGPYKTMMDETGRNLTTQWIVTNTTGYRISSHFRIKNIIGVTRTNAHDGGKIDGSPYDLLGDGPSNGISYGNQFDTSQWSEELQLLADVFDRQLTYVTGLYAADDREDDNYPLSTLEDIGPSLVPYLGVNPAEFFHYSFVNYDRSYAVYAQDTLNLSAITGIQGLKLITGVRYTWERLHLHQSADSVFYPAFGFDPESASESNPSWNITLNYQATSDLLLYVAQRGSWRTGNFNGTSLPNPTTASHYGNLFLPETTHDIEAGEKYQGTFLGRPVRVNGDVYNQWVYNIQRSIYGIISGNPAGFTTNIPSAQTSGFELDMLYRPSAWLELGINGAYTWARYTNGRTLQFGTVYHAGPYADTPLWTGAMFTQSVVPIPSFLGTLTARVEAYGQSRSYFSNLNATTDPGSEIPGYSLVNAQLVWNPPVNARVTIRLFGKNLAGTRYYVGGMPVTGAIGVNTAIPGAPRIYGAELNYKFGGD